MNFFFFTAAIFSFLSSGDTARFVVKNQHDELPFSASVRLAFFAFTAPVTLGVIALPIYGFFVLPWWQPVSAVLVGSTLRNAVTRKQLAGSRWLYAWAMLFSLGGLCFTAAFFFTK